MSTKRNKEDATVPSFTHDEIMKSLYWIWDGFERANMGMFLVGKSLEAALENKKQDADRVEVGVRDVEWTSGSTPVLLDFLGSPDINREHDMFEFICPFSKVPVFIRVYKDSPCIRSTNIVMYEREYFRLPNPMSEFKELYG